MDNVTSEASSFLANFGFREWQRGNSNSKEQQVWPSRHAEHKDELQLGLACGP